MEGDRKTTYFHKKKSQQQRINSIQMLKDDNGYTISDPTEIENLILQFLIAFMALMTRSLFYKKE